MPASASPAPSRPWDRDFVLAQPHPFASVVVDTDAYAAYLGACGRRDGAILIVGTGAAGLAVIAGERINVGGWGDDIADEGSGMMIGRDGDPPLALGAGGHGADDARLPRRCSTGSIAIRRPPSNGPARRRPAISAAWRRWSSTTPTAAIRWPCRS